jgi:hypothetical protein
VCQQPRKKHQEDKKVTGEMSLVDERAHEWRRLGGYDKCADQKDKQSGGSELRRELQNRNDEQDPEFLHALQRLPMAKIHFVAVRNDYEAKPRIACLAMDKQAEQDREANSPHGQ